MIETAFVSPEVAAHIFNITKPSILCMCREGRIPALNLGTMTKAVWRIPISWIRKALTGQARWKYPRSIRRTYRKGSAADEHIARMVKEVESIRFNDDIEGEE